MADHSHNLNISIVIVLFVAFLEIFPVQSFCSEQESTPIDTLGNNCMVGVSSTLGPDYLPYKMFDNNYSTAWVSKSSVNEWIRLACDKPVYILFLTITNGYSESEYSYNSYLRVREINLIFSGFERKVRLMDSSITSYIPIMANTKEIKITITDTYDAILNSSIAVSEVGFVSNVGDELNYNDREFANYKYPKFVLEEVSGVRLEHEDSGTEFVIRHGTGRPVKENQFPEEMRAYSNRDKNQCMVFVKNPGGIRGFYADEIIVWYTRPIDELLDDPENVSSSIKDSLWELFIELCINKGKVIVTTEDRTHRCKTRGVSGNSVFSERSFGATL